MNNNVKIIASTVVTLALVGLSGCGNGSDDGNNNNAASVGNSDTVVMISSAGIVNPSVEPVPDFKNFNEIGIQVEHKKGSLRNAGIQAAVLGCVFPKALSEEERNKLLPVDDNGTPPVHIGLGPDLSTYILWVVPRSGSAAAEKFGLTITIPFKGGPYDPESRPPIPCDTPPSER